MIAAISGHAMTTARFIAMLSFTRYLRFLLLVGGGLVCAACGTIQQTGSGFADKAEPLKEAVQGLANPANDVVSPRPGNKPSIPSPNKSIPAAENANGSNTVELKAEKLLGLSEREVALLLGPAEETFVSPPSRILEYRFADCDVTLYLYANLSTGNYAVLHMEAKPHSGQTDSAASTAICIATISRPASTEGTL